MGMGSGYIPDTLSLKKGSRAAKDFENSKKFSRARTHLEPPDIPDKSLFPEGEVGGTWETKKEEESRLQGFLRTRGVDLPWMNCKKILLPHFRGK